jgi:hypothetical protein
MKPLLAATLATAAALSVPMAAQGAPSQVRSALRAARAPVEQLQPGAAARSQGVSFRRFRQAVGGVPVLGSELVVTDAPGRRGDLVVDHTRRVGAPPRALLSRRAALRAARRGTGIRALRLPPRATLAILPTGGAAKRVWHVLLASAEPVASLEVLVDARSGRVLRTRDLLQYATGTARLFDPNPVVANGGYTGLSDAADADSDLLTSLRVQRTLPRLDSGTCLRGSFAEALLQPGDADADTPDGDVCSPTRDFDAVTRSDNRFEALMAYFHIDRAQSYVQALGFTNVLNHPVRANVDAPIPGPPTEDGQDNSFYDLLTHELIFGTGYADDAEDAETITHEYGHAIQDAQVPGFGESDDGAAMGEGFGDYLASALSAVFAPRAGFEGCFDEWDAFASGFGDCLRRVDWGLRLGEVSSDCTDASDEHCGGEVWSGALWTIRGAVGGTVADRIVIQSHFSLTPTATFDQAVRALLAADSALYGGVHRPLLKAIMGARGLVDVERLDDTPADAVPLALPGRLSGRLSTGADAHDVYALKLTAGRPVVLRLRAVRSNYDLRLLSPGATSLNAPTVAVAEGPNGNEEIHHTPARSGTYYLDVRAISGSDPYTLETASDDRDGDGVADGADLCLNVSDPLQRNWDGDNDGDRCDRSARVILTGLSRKRRRLTVRARMWPATVPATAFSLRLWKRACKRSRCSYRAARTRHATRSTDGRVELRLSLGHGRFRLRGELRASGYDLARTGTRSVLVRR